jgi:hypothetical protein
MIPSVEKDVVFSNLSQLVEFQDRFQERINAAIGIDGKMDSQEVLLDSVVKVCASWYLLAVGSLVLCRTVTDVAGCQSVPRVARRVEDI